MVDDPQELTRPEPEYEALRQERDRLLILVAWRHGIMWHGPAVQRFRRLLGVEHMGTMFEAMAERGRALVEEAERVRD